MAKVTLRTLDNLENQPTALAVINQNFQALATLADTLLSRDGAVPNTMIAILDMNGHKIINLPVPTTPTEPARHGDIQQYVDQAAASADAAAESADDADESEAHTLSLYTNFISRYLGTYASAPAVDALGNSLQEGALYFNSDFDGLYVWTIREVYDGADQVFVGTDAVHVDGWVSIPINTLASMNDVDVFGLVDDQFLQWNSGTGEWKPFTLSAATVPYSGSLVSTNVSAALEEIVARSLFDRYDIEFYLQGLMNEEEHLYRLTALRAFTIPATTTGFVAKSGTPAAGTTVLTLLKNGTQFGTITWSAAGTVGVWSIPGNTVFNIGDVFTLQAPDTPDTSLSDVTVGILARR
jgi:hypothetical protein